MYVLEENISFKSLAIFKNPMGLSKQKHSFQRTCSFRKDLTMQQHSYFLQSTPRKLRTTTSFSSVTDTTEQLQCWQTMKTTTEEDWETWQHTKPFSSKTEIIFSLSSQSSQFCLNQTPRHLDSRRPRSHLKARNDVSTHQRLRKAMSPGYLSGFPSPSRSRWSTQRQ